MMIQEKSVVLLMLSLVTVGCGGSNSKAAASASSSGGTSDISLTTISNDGSPPSKFAISGPTYGFFDSASGAFHVFVVDGSSGPAPACDHLKQLANGSKARLADVYLGKNVTAPGKVDAAGALTIDATSGTPQMSQVNVDGVALDFKSVDAKSFDANIVSAAGSASGSLHGTICPASTFGQDATSGAPPPPMAEAPTTGDAPTDFALEIETSPGSRDTQGVQGNSMAKLDPKTKILAIATWQDAHDFPGEPPHAKPTCDVFAGPKKSLGTNGSVSIIYATKVGKRGAGKFDVYAAEIFAVSPDQPDGFKSAGVVVGSVDVKKFDDKDFAAQFISSAKLNDEKGTIGGTVCPNGHVEAPPAKSEKKSGGKKKP